MERQRTLRRAQSCGMLLDHNVWQPEDESQQSGTSTQSEGEKNIARTSASKAQQKSNEESMPGCCSFLELFSRKKRAGGPKHDKPPKLKRIKGKYRREFVQQTVLGEGISLVYLVSRKSTGAMSAMKVVSLKRVRERRLREFYILRQLDHPNVIRLLDAWQESGMMYLETELCAMTLQHILNAGGNIDIPRRAWNQLVSGLAYLHSKSIVHCDLAPKNIFITESGQLKIGDLGLSKQPGYEAGISLDRKLGNKIYNSGSASPNDLKTDIYALGVLLLDMLLVKQETREHWVWSFSRQKVVPEVLNDPRNAFYFEKISALTSPDRDSRPTAAAILEDESFWPLFDCSFADALKFH